MPTALDTPQTYPGYTNKALDEGVFDQLMLAAADHVQHEYEQGRIQADTYGQVYLGMLEAVLNNSTQYILGLLLLDEKRRGQDLANQKAEYELEVLLPLDAELKQSQIDKIAAEISLMQKQEQKIDKEIEFLDAKILSELANTDETIAAPNSLIGRQINLLRIQGLGFAGDLEAKAAKLHADYDAVFQSVQEIPEAATLGQNAVSNICYILETVEKMKDTDFTDPVFTCPTVGTGGGGGDTGGGDDGGGGSGGGGGGGDPEPDPPPGPDPEPDTNLNNPDFESGDVDWTKGAAWGIVSDGNAFSGSWAGRMTINSSPLVSSILQTEHFSLQGITTVSFNCRIKSDKGNQLSGRAHIRWYDENDIEIGNSYGNVITSNSYSQSSVTANKPAAAAYVSVGCQATTNHTDSTQKNLWVDACSWNL